MIDIIGYPEEKVHYKKCFLLHIETVNKFKFKVPARGYNLKSWIDFQKSLSMTKKVTIKEVTFKEYQKIIPWASE